MSEVTKIRITLEITDEEAVEVYKDVDDSFIKADLRSGNLMDVCEIVSIERV